MLLGSWDLFLKKKLQRATLKNMEQCFSLCFNQNLQSGQKIPRNLGLVASQQVMFYRHLQIKGVTPLFAPYFILLGAFWKSFEATMTYPCPGGRVGTKCPNLWTSTVVTVLITWRFHRNQWDHSCKQIGMAEGRTPEFWILMFHYFCYFCLKLKVLVWWNL